MKLLVAISCLLAVAVAKPSGVVSPLAYSYGTTSVTTGHVAAAPVAYSGLAHTAYAAAPVAYSGYAHASHVAAPVAYSHHVAATPVAHAVAAPVAYSHNVAAAPVAYSHNVAAAPVAHAVAAAPVAYSHTVAAAPVAHAVGVAPVAHAVAVPAIEKTQYHAQNTLGEASYGHSEAFQTHNAIQDAAGNKVGSYSYVAPDGQVIAANYVADALGYRVASNALPVGPAAVPVAPAETPEVVAARAAHLNAHVLARGRRSVAAYATPVAYSTPVVHTYASAPVYTAAIAAPAHAFSYGYY